LATTAVSKWEGELAPTSISEEV
ncbi:MAG: hypothetical protein RL152_1037, partial [Bacteroidota bacterium]